MIAFRESLESEDKIRNNIANMICNACLNSQIFATCFLDCKSFNYNVPYLEGKA